MTNQPLALSNVEIKEIASIAEIQEMWGAEDSEEMELILKESYAVKFDFVSGSPGYVGDLFLIEGDALDGEVPPVTRLGCWLNSLAERSLASPIWTRFRMAHYEADATGIEKIAPVGRRAVRGDAGAANLHDIGDFGLASFSNLRHRRIDKSPFIPV